MTRRELRRLSCEELREWAEELVDKLDELDEADYFGTEGWRRFLDMEIE